MKFCRNEFNFITNREKRISSFYDDETKKLRIFFSFKNTLNYSTCETLINTNAKNIDALEIGESIKRKYPVVLSSAETL